MCTVTWKYWILSKNKNKQKILMTLIKNRYSFQWVNRIQEDRSTKVIEEKFKLLIFIPKALMMGRLVLECWKVIRLGKGKVLETFHNSLEKSLLEGKIKLLIRKYTYQIFKLMKRMATNSALELNFIISVFYLY